MSFDPQSILDDATSAPSSDALSEVAQLASRQIELEDAVAETERHLKNLKNQLSKVSETDLPAALAEHGLSEIAMRDGSKVTVKQIVRASIAVKNRTDAFEWLTSHGFGDLIKHEVKAVFGRGEEAEAMASMDALRDMGCDPEDKLSVHASTLSAFAREQIEAGADIPRDLLGVFIGQQTKISRA